MTGHAGERNELQEKVTQLHAIIQNQQRLVEQSLQQTLQRAATTQAELQRIKAMHTQVLTMQDVLSEQEPRNNPQYLLEMVKQLAHNVQEERQTSQQQVTQALQLALSALSESQTAITENQSLDQMAGMVQQCEEMMQQSQHPSDGVH